MFCRRQAYGNSAWTITGKWLRNEAQSEQQTLLRSKLCNDRKEMKNGPFSMKVLFAILSKIFIKFVTVDYSYRQKNRKQNSFFLCWILGFSQFFFQLKANMSLGIKELPKSLLEICLQVAFFFGWMKHFLNFFFLSYCSSNFVHNHIFYKLLHWNNKTWQEICVFP